MKKKKSYHINHMILKTSTFLLIIKFYQKVLLNFSNSTDGRRLEELYRQENWQEYAVTIHAIKSTSLTIGAVRLSDDAKALEYAARDNWIDFIREHHEAFMQKFDDTCTSIRLGDIKV